MTAEYNHCVGASEASRLRWSGLAGASMFSHETVHRSTASTSCSTAPICPPILLFNRLCSSLLASSRHGQVDPVNLRTWCQKRSLKYALAPGSKTADAMMAMTMNRLTTPPGRAIVGLRGGRASVRGL